MHAILTLPNLREDMEKYLDWVNTRGDGNSDIRVWEMIIALLHFSAYDPVVTTTCIVKIFFYFHSTLKVNRLLYSSSLSPRY